MARAKIPPGIARAILEMVGLLFVASVRVSVNPASVAAEGTGVTTVTVTGAIVGDYVQYGVETADLLNENMGLHVYVSDADEVTIVLSNNTVAAGAAIDLAAATWNFTVSRRSA